MAETPKASASWRMVTPSGPCAANNCSATSHSLSRKVSISLSVRTLGTSLILLRGNPLHVSIFYAINLLGKVSGALMADTQTTIHPHLSGVLAPVRSEDEFEMKVAGRIPDAVRGAYYRNGPNPQFDLIGQYHAFA